MRRAAAAASADSAAAVARTRARSCSPGIYNVSLVVDGKTVETKPLRVTADPEVVLTEVERKKLFDMAMEMHELQKRGTEIAHDACRPLQREATAIATAIGSRTDMPADVKTSFEAFNKELAALAPKFVVAAGAAAAVAAAAARADRRPARWHVPRRRRTG